MKIYIHTKTYINLLEAAFLKTTKNSAQQLGTLLALSEGQSLDPRTLIVVHRNPTPTPEHLMPFSDHHGHLHTHMYTYTHIKRNNFKNKNNPTQAQ